MQAVIKTGGKQFSVNAGDVIQVEKLTGNPGEEIEFKEVLMVSDDKGAVTVGTPFLENAVVKAKIIGENKGKKIDVFKFRRRKDSKKKTGHRQVYTSVEITDISN
jgi:large subunit ribosomal protein L21